MGDITALCRCLRKALKNPERLRAIGREARRHAPRFNFDGITAGLLRHRQRQWRPPAGEA